MDWDSPSFVIAIVAMVMVTAVITTWIQSRTKAAGVSSHAEAGRKAEALERENAGLKEQISRLEQRLAVLERIATDPSERTAREIEQLR